MLCWNCWWISRRFAGSPLSDPGRIQATRLTHPNMEYKGHCFTRIAVKQMLEKKKEGHVVSFPATKFMQRAKGRLCIGCPLKPCESKGCNTCATHQGLCNLEGDTSSGGLKGTPTGKPPYFSGVAPIFTRSNIRTPRGLAVSAGSNSISLASSCCGVPCSSISIKAWPSSPIQAVSGWLQCFSSQRIPSLSSRVLEPQAFGWCGLVANVLRFTDLRCRAVIHEAWSLQYILVAWRLACVRETCIRPSVPPINFMCASSSHCELGQPGKPPLRTHGCGSKNVPKMAPR